MKKISEEELWKIEHYHEEVNKHLECEGGSYFGNELWNHIKSCGVTIPDPKIKAKKKA